MPSLRMPDVVADRWASILSKGLDSKEKATMLEAATLPINLPGLEAPKLNVDLSFLPKTTLDNDRFYIARQAQLGKGIAFLANSLKILLEDNTSKDSNTKVLKSLNMLAKLLCDLHYRPSPSRRALMFPRLPMSLRT